MFAGVRKGTLEPIIDEAYGLKDVRKAEGMADRITFILSLRRGP